jgi:hypothetical protein
MPLIAQICPLTGFSYFRLLSYLFDASGVFSFQLDLQKG